MGIQRWVRFTLLFSVREMLSIPPFSLESGPMHYEVMSGSQPAETDAKELTGSSVITGCPGLRKTSK